MTIWYRADKGNINVGAIQSPAGKGTQDPGRASDPGTTFQTDGNRAGTGNRISASRRTLLAWLSKTWYWWTCWSFYLYIGDIFRTLTLTLTPILTLILIVVIGP